MESWSFDVTVSDHDALRSGVTEKRLHGSQHHWHRVVIAADDQITASLLAAQMAGCQGMVTGVYERI